LENNKKRSVAGFVFNCDNNHWAVKISAIFCEDYKKFEWNKLFLFLYFYNYWIQVSIIETHNYWSLLTHLPFPLPRTVYKPSWRAWDVEESDQYTVPSFPTTNELGSFGVFPLISVSIETNCWYSPTSTIWKEYKEYERVKPIIF
jgi:hypothetical protein